MDWMLWNIIIVLYSYLLSNFNNQVGHTSYRDTAHSLLPYSNPISTQLVKGCLWSLINKYYA